MNFRLKSDQIFFLQKEKDYKDTLGEVYWMMKMFYVLTEVLVTQVYTLIGNYWKVNIYAS